MAPEKGQHHYVECTNKSGIWASVWIPDKLVPTTKKKPFICGFCSQAIVAQLDTILQTLKALEGQITCIRETQITAADQTMEQRITALESQQPQKLDEKPSYATILRNIRQEEKLQQSKEKNIIVTGVPTDGNTDDMGKVYEILTETTRIDPGQIKKVTRINTKRENAKHILRVELDDPRTKWEIIKNARKLRNNSNYREVYINLDLTKEQQERNFQLRTKLRTLRTTQPDKIHYIKFDEVHSREKSDPR